MRRDPVMLAEDLPGGLGSQVQMHMLSIDISRAMRNNSRWSSNSNSPLTVTAFPVYAQARAAFSGRSSPCEPRDSAPSPATEVADNRYGILEQESANIPVNRQIVYKNECSTEDQRSLVVHTDDKKDDFEYQDRTRTIANNDAHHDSHAMPPPLLPVPVSGAIGRTIHSLTNRVGSDEQHEFAHDTFDRGIERDLRDDVPDPALEDVKDFRAVLQCNEAERALRAARQKAARRAKDELAASQRQHSGAGLSRWGSQSQFSATSVPMVRHTRSVSQRQRISRLAIPDREDRPRTWGCDGTRRCSSQLHPRSNSCSTGGDDGTATYTESSSDRCDMRGKQPSVGGFLYKRGRLSRRLVRRFFTIVGSVVRSHRRSPECPPSWSVDISGAVVGFDPDKARVVVLMDCKRKIVLYGRDGMDARLWADAFVSAAGGGGDDDDEGDGDGDGDGDGRGRGVTESKWCDRRWCQGCQTEKGQERREANDAEQEGRRRHGGDGRAGASDGKVGETVEEEDSCRSTNAARAEQQDPSSDVWDTFRSFAALTFLNSRHSDKASDTSRGTTGTSTTTHGKEDAEGEKQLPPHTVYAVFAQP